MFLSSLIRSTAAVAVLAALLLAPAAARAAAYRGISSAEAAQARKVFTAIDADRWTAAHRLTAHASDPLLTKLVVWLDLQRTDTTQDFFQIADFLDANPDWPHQKSLELRAEAVMDSVPDSALKPWFSDHAPISPLAQLRNADLMAQASNLEAARERIESAWVDGNFTADDIRKILPRYSGILSEADHVRRTDRLLWAGEIEQAKWMLPLLPQDWRLLAQARIVFQTGAPGAPYALEQVPQSLRDNGGLMFDRMRWRYLKGDEDGAAAIMTSASDNLGKPDRWWPYRQILARDMLNQGEAEQAYHLAADHELVTGAQAAEAEFLSGWIALRFLNQPNLAYPHFIRLHELSSRPLSVARGAYWAARAAEAEGDNKSARTWYTTAAQYPTTYYGQLAAAEPGIIALPHPDLEAVGSRKDTAVFERQELVRAILILNAGGEDNLVRTFFVTVANRAKSLEDYVQLADLAERIGRPDLGVAVAKLASYADISMVRAGYPVVKMPRNAGAEQALLLAITRQESAFDAKAISPSNARGLMQLEPETAARIARSLGVKYRLTRLTSDGYYNATLGQAFLDDLIARYDGSYVLAIAAYNAGPARVSQWIDKYGDPRVPNADIVDWIEKIPYGETRDYVQRVLENLQVYRLRIGNRDLAFSLIADLRR